MTRNIELELELGCVEMCRKSFFFFLKIRLLQISKVTLHVVSTVPDGGYSADAQCMMNDQTVNLDIMSMQLEDDAFFWYC